MRFAKQRLVIGLLFLMLPFVAVLAFVQTPFVSELVLQFALKVTRFKTGLHVEAKSWNVNPLSFSASLENIEIQISNLRTFAPHIEVRVSPLSLLVGNLHLKEVSLESPRISGKLDPKWRRSSSTNSSEKNIFKRDLPKEIGTQLASVINEIRAHKVSFDLVKMTTLSVDLPELRLEKGDFEVDNLEGGQARLSWKLKNLQSHPYFDQVESLEGSLALLKSSPTEYYLVVPTFHFSPKSDVPIVLEMNGKWPGEFRIETHVDLEQLAGWLKRSPGLKTKLGKRTRGRVDADLNMTIAQGALKRLAGNLSARELNFDGYHINDLETRFHGSLDDLSVDALDIHLPQVAGDLKGWNHWIHSSDIKIKTNEMKGKIELNEAGLCGILHATDVEDCHSGLAASGDIPFEGTLDPFLLKAAPNLKVKDVRIVTDPFGKSPDHIDAPLLELHPATLVGNAEINSKRISIKNTQLQWPDGSAILVDGPIQFKPVLVDLNAETRGGQWKSMFSKFLDLETQGKAFMTAKISYDELLPKEVGQTRVLGRVSIDGAGIEGQNFGTLIGPVNYIHNSLRIGPLKLLNGGGRASIDGTLDSRTDGGYLSMGAVADRLEVVATLPNSGTEAFRGFITGTAALQGYTNPKSPQSMQGPLEFRLDTFKSFGIPFQKGSLKAHYGKRLLEILSLNAQRDRSNVKLHGVLNPDGGTELLFSSEDVPIRSLGLNPGLEILQSGDVRIDGWWRPAKGWTVGGKISKVRIAGKDFPGGEVALMGDQNTFRLKANVGELIRAQFESRSLGKESVPTLLRVDVKDLGFYAAFAYLKGWTSMVPLNAVGDLSLDWTPSRGFLKSSGLQIEGPQGSQSTVGPLLSIKTPKEFSWADGKILENKFQVEGPSKILIGGVPGARTAKLDLSVPLPFLDLVVPNLRFIDGRIEMQGSMPMPPDISTLTASGFMKQGTLYIRGVGQPLQNTSAQLDISRQQLSITDGRGTLGGGNLTVSGVYRVALEKPGVSLQLGLDRAHVVVMDEVPIDVTGDLVLKGEELPYLLAGRVQVFNGLYAKEFKADTSLASLAPQAMLKFGIDAEIGSNVQVKNSVTNTALTGRLLISGTDLVPEVQGKVLLQSGSVFANETEFKIVQGQVNFPGGASGLPVLNLQASTVIKQNNQDYKIELRSRGSVDNLVIEFSSDPALSTSDIVNLLAFGVLRANTSDTPTTSNDLIGAARVEAFQALLGKSLSNNIDKTTGFQVKFKAAPDIAQKELIPKVTVERKLSDRVTATFGRSLDITNPELNGQVDYKLLNNVNLTGIWEKSQTSESSYGVDLRFRFDIK